jgi:hypothetical protein
MKGIVKNKENARKRVGDEREKEINMKRRSENKRKIVLHGFLNIWHH